MQIAKYLCFHQYLTTNWLQYEQLFAGFARHGVMHFNNDTNIRLKINHQVIPGVCSVGVLMDRLQKMISVLAFTA